MKFNITLKELEDAVDFAKKKGQSDHKTVVMEVRGGAMGVGSGILLRKNWYSEKTKDITEYFDL